MVSSGNRTSSKTKKGMGKVSYYTEEGLQKLKEELQQLKTKGRSDISRQIADARDKGDLSENAEYDAAKDAQGHLEAKIAQLEEIVGNARLIDPSKLDDSKVSILSTVKIKNVKNGAQVVYTIVAEEEADLKKGKLSIKSPIGQGLLGKAVGDMVSINVPAGKMEFEILKISLES
jgi:transcription elongation factor GreA